MNSIKHYMPLIICICLQLVGLAVAVSTGNAQIAAVISMVGLGVVVQGQEIDDISDIEKLSEMRTSAVNAIEQLRNKHHESPEEFERSAWDSANADYDALGARIEYLRDSSSIGARWDQIQQDQQRMDHDRQSRRDINDPDDGLPRINDETRAIALQAWAARQNGADLTEQQTASCRALGFNPNTRELRVALPRHEELRELQTMFRTSHRDHFAERARNSNLFESRALATGTASAGGNLIPPGEFIRTLEIAMLQFGGIRPEADIIRTTSGEPMQWPTANDSGNKGRLVAESAASNTTPDPTFGQLELNAYKYTSDAILVPFELLQDSAFDLSRVLAEMTGERLGRITAEHTTTGDGSSKPNGYAAEATTGVTAASTTALTGDEIILLAHSVDPAYRAGAIYTMHDSVASAVRLLKDSEGVYIWRSGLIDGQPDRLNGYRLVINQEMASTLAASAIAMTFGLHSKYKIREVGDIRFHRLVERYRVEADQDAFLSFMRLDGGTLNAGTNPIKSMVMAAS